jgi:hypothetical protein
MLHLGRATRKWGRTCDRCYGEVFARILTPSMYVEFCFEHTKEYSGFTSEELEAAHAPYEDHLSIQGRVDFEQSYMFIHSDWMRPHVDGYMRGLS